MNLKYTWKRERKKSFLKSKRICYYFEERFSVFARYEELSSPQFAVIQLSPFGFG